MFDKARVSLETLATGAGSLVCLLKCIVLDYGSGGDSTRTSDTRGNRGSFDYAAPLCTTPRRLLLEKGPHPLDKHDSFG